MSKRASVDDCRLIRLPKHERENGNITVVENDIDLPFAVKRVYYLYDVPGGEERGGHSHKQLYQLNRPSYGLLIVPGIWRVLNNFSSGSVCLVLTSDYYEESDYIRDYQEFKEISR